jgi:hypothetical protein
VVGLVPALTFGPALVRNDDATASAVVTNSRNVGVSFDGSVLAIPATARNADLDRVKAMGATWVRLAFNWSTLQMNGRGTYNWAPADALVAAANARGLKINAVVSYAPGWARPAGSSMVAPPTNPADYGDFLAAAARRYAPLGVHTWEIWNEPNLFTMWAPRPDVVKYTALLKAAYPKIKAVDPGATVMTGGMSPAYDAPDGSQVHPVTWTKGIYANGGKNYFDAMANHPSSFPYSSNLVADWHPFVQTKTIYSFMESQGDGHKKIWATEIGFPTGTHDRAVSELTQGERMAESIEAWQSNAFAGPIFMYEARDAGTNTNDVYQMFGLYRNDGTPKAGVPRITQALRAPQHVMAVAGTGSATVTWDAPGNDYGTPISGYTIVASPGGATVTVGGSARSAKVPLADGATYRFTVRALHNGTPGVMSVPSNAVTPSVPSVYPTVGSVVEGNSGTRTLNVPVVLSKASTQTVTVNFTTATWAPGYAAAMPQDYDAASGTITFAPGETVKTVAVVVKGDTVQEPGGDKFLVILSNATNANVGGFGGVGVGNIVDDD